MTLDLDLLNETLSKAKSRGATEADVIAVAAVTAAVRARLGDVENIVSSVEKRLGLRVFKGRRCAVNSTSDLDPASIDALVEDTCAMAGYTAEDAFSGLPDPEKLARSPFDAELYDLYDPAIAGLPLEEKIAWARRTDRAALDADPRIVNTEGAEFSTNDKRVFYASSLGFSGDYRTSAFSVGAAPVAKENGSMQAGYWFDVKRRLSDLQTAEDVGAKAARRTLRKLGAKKIKTTRAPIVFEAPCAASLLGSLSEAVNGYSVYKESTYLAGRLGETIAAACVNVTDDPRLPGGLGSKPFDGEGVQTVKKSVVEEGVLQTWLLDAYSARKLSLSTTGNASRGVSGGPYVGSTNLYLKPGSDSLEDLIRSVKRGLLVTDLMGFGVNITTGDYSRGCSGVWIENGELAYPVEEITIAGHLDAMLKGIEAVGSDLLWLGSTASPSLKIQEMAIAGS